MPTARQLLMRAIWPTHDPTAPAAVRHDDSLARLWLADLEQAEVGRQAVHAEHAQRGRQRQIAIGDRTHHHLRIDGGVVLPAELAGDVLTLPEPRVARRFDTAGRVGPHHLADANRL